MEDLEKWCDNLHRDFVVANGVRTAVFRAGTLPKEDRPLSNILLIHGINGSHLGLAKLAQDLEQKGFQPILVDLPGHGDSDLPVWSNLAGFRRWFGEIFQRVSEKFDSIDHVIAHSLGCFMVDTQILPNAVQTTFICPVSSTSWFYGVASQLVRWVFYTKFLVRFYNWPVFAEYRGNRLLRIKTANSRQYVKFLSYNDIASTEQRRYQGQLAGAIGRAWKDAFHEIKPSKVIIGKDDKLALERTATQMQPVFPQSEIVTVDGGHLAPIENPAEIVEFLN